MSRGARAACCSPPSPPMNRKWSRALRACARSCAATVEPCFVDALLRCTGVLEALDHAGCVLPQGRRRLAAAVTRKLEHLGGQMHIGKTLQATDLHGQDLFGRPDVQHFSARRFLPPRDLLPRLLQTRLAGEALLLRT